MSIYNRRYDEATTTWLPMVRVTEKVRVGYLEAILKYNSEHEGKKLTLTEFVRKSCDSAYTKIMNGEEI